MGASLEDLERPWFKAGVESARIAGLRERHRLGRCPIAVLLLVRIKLWPIAGSRATVKL